MWETSCYSGRVKKQKNKKKLDYFVDVCTEQCHFMPVGRVTAQQNRIIKMQWKCKTLKLFPNRIYNYVFNIKDACL